MVQDAPLVQLLLCLLACQMTVTGGDSGLCRVRQCDVFRTLSKLPSLLNQTKKQLKKKKKGGGGGGGGWESCIYAV